MRIRRIFVNNILRHLLIEFSDYYASIKVDAPSLSQYVRVARYRQAYFSYTQTSVSLPFLRRSLASTSCRSFFSEFSSWIFISWRRRRLLSSRVALLLMCSRVAYDSVAFLFVLFASRIRFNRTPLTGGRESPASSASTARGRRARHLQWIRMYI